jgi:hypothetical protein
MVARMVHRRLSNLVCSEKSPALIAVPPETIDEPETTDEGDGAPAGSPRSAGPAVAAEGEPQSAASISSRSAERRHWSEDLVNSGMAGLVLHGAGGIGKSTLAAEITARVGRLEPGLMTAVFDGEVSADGFLAGVAAALRRHPMAAAWDGGQAEAVEMATRTELPWADRLGRLREHVLRPIAVLVVLDNFDDNLSAESGRRIVRDPALASLLASWVGTSHSGRLLITCRHPFTPPGAARRLLGLRHVGPLSRSSAVALARSLPALGQLDDQDLDRAWRMLGGHPHAMRYLDALLSTGDVYFPDVAHRLAAALQLKTGRPVPLTGPDAPTELPAPAAETVARTACDLLLAELCARLSTDAQNLLIQASVYRAPIGLNALLLPVGQYSADSADAAALVAECEASALLAADLDGDPPSVFVHRWTASGLHRRLAETRRGGELAEAHRRAAEYCWCIATWPDDPQVRLEASYHLVQAGDLAGQDQPGQSDEDQPDQPGQPETSRAISPAQQRLRLLGLVATTLAVAVIMVFSAQHLTASLAAAREDASASQAAMVRGQAAAVRGQTAAWVARQVSGNAIVACDPVMCSALQAHGILAANLLVLRAATSDPLGSDVVVATAAVRSQFGGRLASVYAPEILARFGSGEMRIDVRVVAPDGAAAYQAALRPDVAARQEAGRQLARNPRISVSAAGRRELSTGQVDSRLLTTLAMLAAAEPVQVTAFGDAGPGASAGMPLRGVEVAVSARAAGRAAALWKMLTLALAQRPPYFPAQAAIVRSPSGSSVLSIEFAAPSPGGLLQPHPAR